MLNNDQKSFFPTTYRSNALNLKPNESKSLHQNWNCNSENHGFNNVQIFCNKKQLFCIKLVIIQKFSC